MIIIGRFVLLTTCRRQLCFSHMQVLCRALAWSAKPADSHPAFTACCLFAQPSEAANSCRAGSFPAAAHPQQPLSSGVEQKAAAPPRPPPRCPGLAQRTRCLMTSLKVRRMAVSGAILSTLVPLPLKYARKLPAHGPPRHTLRISGSSAHGRARCRSAALCLCPSSLQPAAAILQRFPHARLAHAPERHVPPSRQEAARLMTHPQPPFSGCRTLSSCASGRRALVAAS